MTEARPNFAHLEPTHSRAIRHEIGERLRLLFDRDRSPVPARLRGLLSQFEETDVRAHLRSSTNNESKPGKYRKPEAAKLT
jgi:hypothetical protein